MTTKIIQVGFSLIVGVIIIWILFSFWNDFKPRDYSSNNYPDWGREN